MKIRFSKSDVFDTKGESAEVEQLANAPIYTVQLTEEEVGYIKQFVEACAGVPVSDGCHLVMNVAKPESEDKCLILAEMPDEA